MYSRECVVVCLRVSLYACGVCNCCARLESRLLRRKGVASRFKLKERDEACVSSSWPRVALLDAVVLSCVPKCTRESVLC